MKPQFENKLLRLLFKNQYDYDDSLKAFQKDVGPYRFYLEVVPTEDMIVLTVTKEGSPLPIHVQGIRFTSWQEFISKLHDFNQSFLNDFK